MIQYIILFIITFFIIMNIFEFLSLALLYFQYKRWIKYRNKFIHKICVDYELINLRSFQVLIEERYEEFTRFNKKYAELISNLDQVSLKLADDIEFVRSHISWLYEPFNMFEISSLIQSNILCFQVIRRNISLIQIFCGQLSACTFVRESYYKDPVDWMHRIRKIEKDLDSKAIENGGVLL